MRQHVMLFGDGHENWYFFPSIATMEKWFLDILVKYSRKNSPLARNSLGAQESYHQMETQFNIYIAQK